MQYITSEPLSGIGLLLCYREQSVVLAEKCVGEQFVEIMIKQYCSQQYKFTSGVSSIQQQVEY